MTWPPFVPWFHLPCEGDFTKNHLRSVDFDEQATTIQIMGLEIGGAAWPVMEIRGRIFFLKVLT